MARQGTYHLDFISIIGGQGVSANQEEDDVCVIKMPVNLPLPLLASDELTEAPARGDPFSSQQGQVCLNGFSHGFVPVAVAVEQAEGAGCGFALSSCLAGYPDTIPETVVFWIC